LIVDRRAAYLVGTSRSVGRGWSLRPPPTRIHLSTNCRQEHDLNVIKLAESFSDKTRYFEESVNLLYQNGKVSEGLEVYYWKKKDELFRPVQSNPLPSPQEP